MTHIGNVPANVMNIPSSDDSTFTTRIVNPRMSNVHPLEVNQPIVNPIILRDNSILGGGSIEDGSKTFSFHYVGDANDSFKRDKVIGHDSTVVMGVSVGSHPIYHFR